MESIILYIYCPPRHLSELGNKIQYEFMEKILAIYGQSLPTNTNNNNRNPHQLLSIVTKNYIANHFGIIDNSLYIRSIHEQSLIPSEIKTNELLFGKYFINIITVSRYMRRGTCTIMRGDNTIYRQSCKLHIVPLILLQEYILYYDL